MQISDHDLRQLDEAYLECGWLGRWRTRYGRRGRIAGKKPRRRSRKSSAKAGKPGRRKGTPGHSRTQQLPVDAEVIHTPNCYAGCGAALSQSHERRTHNARYEIDLVRSGAEGNGLVVHQTKDICYEQRCGCRHWTGAEPGRCKDEGDWTVALSEWHLAGPTLVSFICPLSLRMRLSRARVREFLSDWLDLSLSTTTINQCAHEAARAVEPAVDNEILETRAFSGLNDGSHAATPDDMHSRP